MSEQPENPEGLERPESRLESEGPEESESPEDLASPPVRGARNKRGQRHGRARRFVVRPLIWMFAFGLALAAALWLFLESPFAKSRARVLVSARLTELLGRPIRVEEVDFGWLPLDVELRGVVIPGPTAQSPPFAVLPRVRVLGAWRGLSDGKVNLEQIEIERPRFELYLGPNGETNLPEIADTGGGSSAVDVHIGRILITDGTFVLDERTLPLALEAHAIHGRLLGQGPLGADSPLLARLTAQDVTTTLPAAKPYGLTAAIRAAITPGRVAIENVRLAAPEIRADLSGDVTWKGIEWDVALDIAAEGEAALFNRLGYLGDPIEGPFTFAGRFLADRTKNPAYSEKGAKEQKKGVPPTSAVPRTIISSSWSGDLAAPRVRFLDRDWTEIAAGLRGDPRRVDVAVNRLRYAEGVAQGTVVVDLASPPPGVIDNGAYPVAVDLEVREIDVRRFLADLGPELELAVASRAAGKITYRATADDLIAGQGEFALTLAPNPNARGGLAIGGDLPIIYDRGIFTSRGFRLVGPALDATGDAAWDVEQESGNVTARLSTGDLAAVARLFPGAATEPPPLWRPERGRGTVDATLETAADGTVVAARFDLADVASGALTADSIVGTLRYRESVSPNDLGNRLEDVEITARRGAAVLAVSGFLPLPADGGVIPARAPIGLAVTLDRWPASEIARWVPNFPIAEVGGRLDGRADLGGTWSELSGSGQIAIEDFSLGGQTLGRAMAEARFAGPNVEIAAATIGGPAGLLSARGTIDRANERLNLAIEAPALDLAQEPLRSILGGDLSGRAALHATVVGTFDAPDARLTLRAIELAFAGRPLGAGGASQLIAEWDGSQVTAQGSLVGLATFRGGGRLDTRGADAKFDLSSRNLAGLLGIAGVEVAPTFTGGFQGRAALSGEFAADTFGAEVTLDQLDATFDSIVAPSGRRTVRNLEPVVVRLAGEKVDIRSLYLGEAASGSELFVAGTISTQAVPPGTTATAATAATPANSSPQLDLKAQTTLSASWLRELVPTIDLTGFVDAIATVRGTADRPAIRGEGELRDARLIVPDLPNAFEGLRGSILFNRDEIVFDDFRARTGTGTVLLSGRMDVPAPDRELDYSVQLVADGLSLRYPEGFFVRGHAELALGSVKGGGRQVRGVVDLDQAFYLDDVAVGTLDLLKGVFRRERVEVVEADEALASTALSVAVRGPGALRVRNNVADLRGDVDLQVRGTAARPSVIGRVDIQEGGTIVWADNEYEIDRGRITFDNPSRIDPVIDLVAKTRVKNFDIALNLSGTVDRLDAKFSTDEGLADLDVLALLATGNEIDSSDRIEVPGGSGGLESLAPRTSSASTILADQIGRELTGRVRTLFGFDRLRVDPLAGTGGEAISGVQVTVGKRLSRNLFVTYTTNPATSQNNILQVEWQVGRDVVLVFTRNGDESYSVDAQWERRY